MMITISRHQIKERSYSALAIAYTLIIMIYLIIVVANYTHVQLSISDLPDRQGSMQFLEAAAPLPVPTPPSVHSQITATPIPPESVQAILVMAPQPVPTPRLTQIP